ncbi:hypothetical protein AB0D66_31410 [Streptomyces sp. NPDC048270]|uniref:hypothetical protein n=1 Tax=Streptomyces sp. NPDC048270 TaxID=3154615 RepID=UPI0033F5112B
MGDSINFHITVPINNLEATHASPEGGELHGASLHVYEVGPIDSNLAAHHASARELWLHNELQMRDTCGEFKNALPLLYKEEMESYRLEEDSYLAEKAARDEWCRVHAPTAQQEKEIKEAASRAQRELVANTNKALDAARKDPFTLKSVEGKPNQWLTSRGGEMRHVPRAHFIKAEDSKGWRDDARAVASHPFVMAAHGSTLYVCSGEHLLDVPVFTERSLWTESLPQGKYQKGKPPHPSWIEFDGDAYPLQADDAKRLRKSGEELAIGTPGCFTVDLGGLGLTVVLPKNPASPLLSHGEAYGQWLRTLRSAHLSADARVLRIEFGSSSYYYGSGDTSEAPIWSPHCYRVDLDGIEYAVSLENGWAPFSLGKCAILAYTPQPNVVLVQDRSDPSWDGIKLVELGELNSSSEFELRDPRTGRTMFAYGAVQTGRKAWECTLDYHPNMIYEFHPDSHAEFARDVTSGVAYPVSAAFENPSVALNSPAFLISDGAGSFQSVTLLGS